MIVARLGAIAIAGLLASGCAQKESPATDSTTPAGTTSGSAQVESAASIDSPAVVDSTPPPPSDATGNLTGETRSRDLIIGRDSAFGPIGTMDSDGTVRPIRK